MYKGNQVSVVIPALNEEKAIHIVVKKLLMLQQNNQAIIDEVVVCDNGSTDNTAEAAKNAGARVVFQKQTGYGVACLTAISALKTCDIVLFVDGDDSCDIEQALHLLAGIVNGDDLAIGSRTLGCIAPGALTKPQLFGNWLSSRLIYQLWKQQITDLGPFRAIRYQALKKLRMQDKTFGWTVEMQIKAIMLQLNMSEYPVDSKVRIGQSKISGTLSGSVKAGIGILSMIAKLYLTNKLKQTKHKSSSYE